MKIGDKGYVVNKDYNGDRFVVSVIIKGESTKEDCEYWDVKQGIYNKSYPKIEVFATEEYVNKYRELLLERDKIDYKKYFKNKEHLMYSLYSMYFLDECWGEPEEDDFRCVVLRELIKEYFDIDVDKCKKIYGKDEY